MARLQFVSHTRFGFTIDRSSGGISLSSSLITPSTMRKIGIKSSVILLQTKIIPPALLPLIYERNSFGSEILKTRPLTRLFSWFETPPFPAATTFPTIYSTVESQ